MGLLVETGEYAAVADSRLNTVPVYQPPPTQVWGEREDLRGDYSPAPIYEAAQVPLHDFAYGPRFNRWAQHLPRPGLYTAPALHWSRYADFMQTTQGLFARDEAVELVGTVMNLLESPAASGRVEVYSAPFKSWALNDNVSARADAIRALFGASHPGSLIRDDAQDTQGTRVWLAQAGAWFLLVERSVLADGPRGTPVVRRLIEAVTYTNAEDARAVLDQLSLTEEIRVAALAHYCNAQPDEFAMLAHTANRASVQSDQAVLDLITRWRYPPRPPAYQRAVAALRGLTGNILRRVTSEQST